MKLLRKVICFLVVAAVLNLFGVNTVLAAEKSEVVELDAVVTEYNVSGTNIGARSTTFIDTSIDISYSSSGMYVVIHTSMNSTASVVGAKGIEIQIKNGSDWDTVATSSGGEAYNVGGCAVSLTYTGVIYGETYRVVCTHYGDVDGYRELYHETVGAKCIY